MKYLLLVQALGEYFVYFVLNYHLWISEICKLQCTQFGFLVSVSCSCVITFSFPTLKQATNLKVNLLSCLFVGSYQICIRYEVLNYTDIISLTM